MAQASNHTHSWTTDRTRTERTSSSPLPNGHPSNHNLVLEDVAVLDAKPLKPLTSLKWPSVPEETSFHDPLKRDDPKPLNLHQYHAIATSSQLRSALSRTPTLPALLRKLDKLRGPEREVAIETLLGISNPQIRNSLRKEDNSVTTASEEDRKALKQLVEAIEKAVRGENPNVLGLDWAEDGL